MSLVEKRQDTRKLAKKIVEAWETMSGENYDKEQKEKAAIKLQQLSKDPKVKYFKQFPQIKLVDRAQFYLELFG